MGAVGIGCERAPRGTAAIVACASLAALGCGGGKPADLDVVLHGGVVLDGSGEPGERADVGIRDGRIAEIGSIAPARGTRAIDVTGRAIAPGFVDIHSHADLVLLAEPAARERLLEAKIRQGVTTVVVGNCGLGVAPASPEAAEILAGVNGWMTPIGVRAGPLSVDAYLDRLETSGVPLNVATLVPHGPLRISAGGLREGPVDAEETSAQRDALRRGLAAGALGLSVGLIYPPGMYSDTDELVALAEVVAEHDGVFTAHVRGSSETLLRAVEELIEIAERADARVHHSHFEAVGEPYWPDIEQALALEDAARERGLRVTHDMFPYDRAATMMAAIYPPWSLDGGVPALLGRLRDAATRDRIARAIEDVRPEWPPWRPGGWPHNLVAAVGWDGIVVASVPNDAEAVVGRSIAALARDAGTDPFDVAAELMLRHDGEVGMFVAEISGDSDRLDGLRAILRHPAAALVSDAEDYGHGVPHPAHAGAFARGLRWAREGVVPLPETVRRMTALPAQIVGLAGRGRIAPGAPADLVVFDPETVADPANDADPRAHASGVSHVWIGGVSVVDDGRYNPGSHGSVLRATHANPGPESGDRGRAAAAGRRSESDPQQERTK